MGIDASEVPQEVRDAFARLFPEAAPAWEMEAQYEAEFEQDGKEVEVNFAADGTLLQIEYEIDVDSLPAAVVHVVRQDFPQAEIKEAERVELPDGRTLYELDLEEDGAAIEIHVAVDARIVAIGDDL